ncbi:hypothetical protein F511_13862 [Dorcoceras hygrometricum]|uniref:Uncharacterized protein n=1 Tax=Dorcoceras hygrometricum TaxID=472368 RepID=A0A2Z7BSL1_9LAMI|nr:hypothetical protein F511_13862 [Dorcoceras hygrometricum]
MTSAVMSSQSADEESLDGALSEDGDNQQRASTSRGNLKLAIAKRCRSNKLQKRKDKDPADDVDQQYIQKKATAHPVESFNEPAVSMHSVTRCCTSRKHFTTNDWTTSCKYIQTKATAHPVESSNDPAVAMNPVAVMNQQRSS